MAEKVFVEGMIFKAPHPKAPDFVRGSISVKVDEFILFAEKNKTESGWINIDVKESKSGKKLYCELNTYSKKQREEAPTENAQPTNDDLEIDF